MQFRKTLLLGILSLSLLSGCSLFSSEEDATKVSPLPQVTNQFSPSKLWDTSVGNGIGRYYSHLSPAAEGGRIYAADRDGVVSALDAGTGKAAWSVNLAEKRGTFSASQSAKLSGGLTVSGNNLYVGSERAVLYALSRENGTVIWQSNVAGEALSRPVVSEGLVLVHTSNGMLQALNESDGTIRWTVNLDVPNLSLRGESAPVVAFGAAIVGSNSGRVNAILLQGGQMIWQQRISIPKGGTEIDRLSDVNTTPIVIDNLVYAMGYNGNLVAMDLRSGQIVWRRELGAVNDFIIEASRLYMVDQNDNVMSLSLEGGTSVWKQSALSHRGLTAPTFYQGYLIVADNEGYVHWIEVSDGQFVAQQKVDSSGFLSAPLVVDDKIILQARNGKVYAFKR